ncbi:MAG TPA: carboxymuconolactone decarboxylase family protein [Gammaproteobacteria bacterium]|nr:carboxymuconolactone decarboxylase family protein [Gammaproteobacteria bacterium]
MSRLKALLPSELDSEQRALFDAITTGKRSEERSSDDFFLEDGGLRGPFNAWVHAPGIGQPAQLLGEAIRYQTRLPPKLRELAILTVAARWRADYEWWAHSRIAGRLGLGDEIIAALKDETLPSAADAGERAVHRFAIELMDTHQISVETYREIVALLGDAGTVELVALLGYYTLVSMTLNVFRVPTPAGETPPFAAES